VVLCPKAATGRANVGTTSRHHDRGVQRSRESAHERRGVAEFLLELFVVEADMTA